MQSKTILDGIQLTQGDEEKAQVIIHMYNHVLEDSGINAVKIKNVEQTRANAESRETNGTRTERGRAAASRRIHVTVHLANISPI